MRCSWASEVEPIYKDYHDQEWGRPIFDDQVLFEMLCLEGAQAGLSWITVLKKREHYRKVFDHFDTEKMAAYDQSKIDALLDDPGIIRNRLKVRAFIENAKAYIKIRQSHSSFASYIWSFVDGVPIQNQWTNETGIPASTEVSEKMSKQLKKDGFKFVGPTICYAFMQAVGMVNDHTVECFCHEEVSKLKVKI